MLIPRTAVSIHKIMKGETNCVRVKWKSPVRCLVGWRTGSLTILSIWIRLNWDLIKTTREVSVELEPWQPGRGWVPQPQIQTRIWIVISSKRWQRATTKSHRWGIEVIIKSMITYADDMVIIRSTYKVMVDARNDTPPTSTAELWWWFDWAQR